LWSLLSSAVALSAIGGLTVDAELYKTETCNQKMVSANVAEQPDVQLRRPLLV
jgi:hypothetical protein